MAVTSTGVNRDTDVMTRRKNYIGGTEVKLHEILIMLVDIYERKKVRFFVGCNTKLLSVLLIQPNPAHQSVTCLTPKESKWSK